MKKTLESDFSILKKCADGNLFSDEDYPALHRLATCGFARCGTEIIVRADGKIELRKTAKTTMLGKFVLKNQE
jgi:hypothetical protein